MSPSDAAENVPPAVSERRKPSRRRTFLGALAVSRNGAHTIECTIRNLSEQGGRIGIAKGQAIPKHLYLIVSGRAIAYEAVVAWIRTREVGLSFVRPLTLESLKGSELDFLRRLMVEKLPRTSVA